MLSYPVYFRKGFECKLLTGALTGGSTGTNKQPANYYPYELEDTSYYTFDKI